MLAQQPMQQFMPLSHTAVSPPTNVYPVPAHFANAYLPSVHILPSGGIPNPYLAFQPPTRLQTAAGIPPAAVKGGTPKKHRNKEKGGSKRTSSPEKQRQPNAMPPAMGARRRSGVPVQISPNQKSPEQAPPLMQPISPTASRMLRRLSPQAAVPNTNVNVATPAGSAGAVRSLVALAPANPVKRSDSIASASRVHAPPALLPQMTHPRISGNLNSPPLSPLTQATTTPTNASLPPLEPGSRSPVLGSTGPSFVHTTTTTTTTTTMTPLVVPPVDIGSSIVAGTATSPAGSASSPILTNTVPDLLFLLSASEHQSLMHLLRGRIDGATTGLLTVSDPTGKIHQANRSPPPFSISRRQSFTGAVATPAGTLVGTADDAPPSPSAQGIEPVSVIRGRSNSLTRAPLPRRNSLQSVREEDKTGAPLPTNDEEARREELLRAMARPRANSLVSRPIGGGGVVSLPPNWSRRGSASSVGDEDSEPGSPLLTTVTTSSTQQHVALLLPDGTRSNENPTQMSVVLDGVPTKYTRTQSQELPGTRRVASSNRPRFSLEAPFSAALAARFAPGFSNMNAAVAARARPPGSGGDGSAVDQELEENGSQYWSLSHAALLLERIALEKSVTPQFSAYLSQALEAVGTARGLAAARITRRLSLEQQLGRHPEQVADWLSEFAPTSESVLNTARAMVTTPVAPAPIRLSIVGKASSESNMLVPPTHSGLARRNPSTSNTLTMMSPKAASSSSSSSPQPQPPVATDGVSATLVTLDAFILKDAAQTLLSKSLSWDLEIFELHSASNGHSLLLLAMHLVRQCGSVTAFPHLDLTKFFNFMRCIESGYHAEVPYHNSVHGADVLQGVAFFLQSPLLKEVLTPLDVLAALTAAACHDYDHRGRNNSFMVATSHRLALLYNDTSVMEAHHASSSWALLIKPENNFLESFSLDDRLEFRSSFLSVIAHTDMSLHMKTLLDFENGLVAKRNHGLWFSSASKEDRRSLLDMACHVSDLGNPAKPRHLAAEWTDRVVKEFYAQGDAEKSLGLKVSPMMDREKAAIDAQQVRKTSRERANNLRAVPESLLTLALVSSCSVRFHRFRCRSTVQHLGRRA
jgi:hypothetical protein